MFGKKKEITQKFIVENEDGLEYYDENEPKRDKNKNAQPKIPIITLFFMVVITNSQNN